MTGVQTCALPICNGCNLLLGDLLATGTVSGQEDESAGCLLELTAGGAKPVLLPNGERRGSLEDGDEVILRGVCRRDGFPEISLGECRGIILPTLLSADFRLLSRIAVRCQKDKRPAQTFLQPVFKCV